MARDHDTARAPDYGDAGALYECSACLRHHDGEPRETQDGALLCPRCAVQRVLCKGACACPVARVDVDVAGLCAECVPAPGELTTAQEIGL